MSLAVHDNDLAGILQVAVAESVRRQGVGSAIVNASLRWARLRGARTAWLSVEADNEGRYTTLPANSASRMSTGMRTGGKEFDDGECRPENSARCCLRAGR